MSRKIIPEKTEITCDRCGKRRESFNGCEINFNLLIGGSPSMAPMYAEQTEDLCTNCFRDVRLYIENDVSKLNEKHVGNEIKRWKKRVIDGERKLLELSIAYFNLKLDHLKSKLHLHRTCGCADCQDTSGHIRECEKALNFNKSALDELEKKND